MNVGQYRQQIPSFVPNQYEDAVRHDLGLDMHAEGSRVAS